LANDCLPAEGYYKGELVQKLNATENTLKEIVGKYLLLEDEYEKCKAELLKVKEKCNEMERERAKAEVSLKVQVKSLITKLAKMRSESSSKKYDENNNKVETTLRKRLTSPKDRRKSLDTKVYTHSLNKDLSDKIVVKNLKTTKRHLVNKKLNYENQHNTELVGIRRTNPNVMGNISMNTVQREYTSNSNIRRSMHNY
jgi:vacuolar-type H+-ATPase subunit I/STV1